MPQVLVNNAGLHCELLPIAETTPEAWMQTFQVNVFGPYLICRAFLTGMMALGWGRVINVSSAASLGEPTHIGSVYQLSKVTLNHFTRQLAVEVDGSGVTANAIHPGEVQTEMWAAIKAMPRVEPAWDEMLCSGQAWSKRAEVIRPKKPPTWCSGSLRPITTM